MGRLRNEDTKAGKDMWRKVDEAAERAPLWVRSHIDTLVAQRATQLNRSEKEQTEMQTNRSTDNPTIGK